VPQAARFCRRTRRVAPRLTPKGEAKKALESAEACLSEFETISSSDPQDTFVRRLNEFLVSARRISEFLPKETGRATGLETWMEQEHDNLLSDPRYAYFGALRNISTHDCIVRPDIRSFGLAATSRQSCATLRLGG